MSAEILSLPEQLDKKHHMFNLSVEPIKQDLLSLAYFLETCVGPKPLIRDYLSSLGMYGNTLSNISLESVELNREMLDFIFNEIKVEADNNKKIHYLMPLRRISEQAGDVNVPLTFIEKLREQEKIARNEKVMIRAGLKKNGMKVL